MVTQLSEVSSGVARQSVNLGGIFFGGVDNRFFVTVFLVHCARQDIILSLFSELPPLFNKMPPLGQVPPGAVRLTHYATGSYLNLQVILSNIVEQ